MSVIDEISDPEDDSGCVRMPPGVATRTQSARVWGHTPKQIDIGVARNRQKLEEHAPKMFVCVCLVVIK